MKTILKIILGFILLFYILFFVPVKDVRAHEIEDDWGTWTPLVLSDQLSAYSYDYARKDIPTSDCRALPIDEFERKKKGLCRDFAYYSAVVLDRYGYETYMLYYQRPNGNWHIVTVFEWQRDPGDRGNVWAFSNNQLMGPLKNRDEVLSPALRQYVIPIRRNRNVCPQ